MPGAMTPHDDGMVVILGRAYLIAVLTTALRVERTAGICQAIYVRTPASVIGYVYGLDSQWWLGTPRTPDRTYFSVNRLKESEIAVTLAFQCLESSSPTPPAWPASISASGHWPDCKRIRYAALAHPR